MDNFVNITDVCSEIFAGGDAPKPNMSVTKTDEYKIPIFSNGEADNGLYGYTNFARVTKPSITVSARGTIGFVAVRNEPFVPIVRLISLTPDPEKIEIRYLYYAIQNYKFDGSGTSIPQLTVPMLKKHSFPLPTKEQQLAIIDQLDNVCNLISLRRQQLAKLDELVKSRFIEMFGDPEDSTTKWERTTFSSVCIDMHQGINTVADKVEYVNSGFPIIQSKNITSGYLDLEDVRYVTESDYEYYRNKYNPKNSDLLVCNIGTIGKSLIVKNEVDFLIAWNLFLIKLNKELVNPIFIKVFIELLNQQNYFEKFMTGGTVKFVNKKTMGNISTPTPPMALQEQFVAFVEQTDKSKFEIQKSLEKLETLKKALMQKYFG